MGDHSTFCGCGVEIPRTQFGAPRRFCDDCRAERRRAKDRSHDSSSTGGGGGPIGRRREMPPTMARALAQLDGTPLGTSEVAESLGIEFPTALDALTRLARRGLVDRLGTHTWRRRADDDAARTPDAVATEGGRARAERLSGNPFAGRAL